MALGAEDPQRRNHYGESRNVSDVRRKKRLQAEAWVNDAKWSLLWARSLLLAASHRPLKPDARQQLKEICALVAELEAISEARPERPAEQPVRSAF